ncbi:MAG: polyhydroxybutyrate depolymerase, partial [Frankiales bacterium]|nr:polyhydroxybutyrate depolymerase [Frankiales bacterium]
TSDRLVAARPVALPGADATGAARLSVTSGGVDRPYLLAPARRTGARARPALLVLLPAANTTLRAEYDRYGLDALRDHGLTVLVAGTYAASWNAGSCCGRPRREGIDDVAALVAMRDDALRRSGADPDRVAVAGHSVGALMAWRLACTPAFRAAAVVAVSGTLVHPCPSPLTRTPRVLLLNGDLDTTVPVDGSDRVVTVLGVAPPSVRESVLRLAASGRCGPAVSRRVEDGLVQDHPGCTGGGSVRFQLVRGQGHPWDGLQATRRLAAFLAEALTGVR